jgi:hypothetical protein
MYKQNHKFLEKKLEDKLKRREKKKKKSMKVSGGEVKKLQKIIKEK